MNSYGRKKMSIVVNSPVVLGFAGLCALVLALDMFTGGYTTSLLFSVYRAPLLSPFTWFRFFGHVFGHAGVEHLVSNMMFILVIGPMLEDKYGSRIIIWVIAITAAVTGIFHYIVFPGSALLGASGVVFAFILLASFTGIKSNEIPLTFILVAVLYLGQQVYEGIFVSDNVSQLTHILGGCVGAVVGFKINKR